LRNQIDVENPNHPTMVPFENPEDESDFIRHPFWGETGQVALIQIPSDLPIILEEQKIKDEEKEEKKEERKSVKPPNPNPLSGVSDGRVGKIVVYKSGKVEWKIGDYVFEVQSQGTKDEDFKFEKHMFIFFRFKKVFAVVHLIN
jgi:hypothetical protein